MAAKYERLEKIGSGAFGSAWLVLRRCTDRKYVLKEIPVLGLTEKVKKQALTEVRALAKCRHVNVVKYKEAFVHNVSLCIVMEYADGGDLGQKIKMNRSVAFQTDVILDWIIQIFFALKSIHSLNIIHRDLKTQNIFMTLSGVIKVGDLGIARILNSNEDHANTVIGTPYYLSPEICARKPYDYKTDMWAAGCVLYELCTFHPPFEGSCVGSLLLKIIAGKYKPVHKSYGPIVEDLISVLLDTNPDRRPSAGQVLAVPSLQPFVRNCHKKMRSVRENSVPNSPLNTPQKIKNIKLQKEKIKTPVVDAGRSKRSLPTPQQRHEEKTKRVNSTKAQNSVINRNKSNVDSPRVALYKEVLRKGLQLSPLVKCARPVWVDINELSGAGGREIPVDREKDECTRRLLVVDSLYADKDHCRPSLDVQVDQLVQVVCNSTNTTADTRRLVERFLREKLGSLRFRRIRDELDLCFDKLREDRTVSLCLPLLLHLVEWERCSRDETEC